MPNLTRITNSEAETAKLGRDIALAMATGSGAGDLLLLSGDLGAGKTALARAIIRQLADNDEYEVPSPTYTLCHLYEFDICLAHYDLYRLSGIDELDELGWEEQLQTGSAIMEWPERCFDTMPTESVHVTINQTGRDTREIDFRGTGKFMDRIIRSVEIADFIATTPLKEPHRKHQSADASARSYEIINDGTEEFFLMNSPAITDGPIIQDGKPYSQIAHLAESVDAFVGVGKILRECGAMAPEIPYFDLDAGLLLIQHLGNDVIIDENRQPISERYLASMEFLAKLHQNTFERTVNITSGRQYIIPNYDEQAILIETELLLDWYAPAYSENSISAEQSEQFKAIWRGLYAKISAYEQSLVQRDFHSPNIIWVADQQGTNRVGVIDFQDALIGPASYDVASLAQDARVDVSAELELQLINHYIECRKMLEKPFDTEAFNSSYAVMAAQRATKILGIFIRLNERDGKPEYLKHLPRMRDYLKRSLSHPVLSDYKQWIDTVIKL